MERRHEPARASERAPDKKRMDATAAIHAIALAACFAAHLAFAGEFDGVRRALQTMAAAQAHPVAPVNVAGAPVVMTA